jgi:hypothetical protein
MYSWIQSSKMTEQGYKSRLSCLGFQGLSLDAMLLLLPTNQVGFSGMCPLAY